MTKPTVAIITDSASDIPPDAAKQLGIAIVPIIVTFGSESFKVNEEMSMDDFWRRLTAPGAPFPKTAAPAPAAFTAAYDRAFAGGAEEIVSVHVASKLSATYRNAEIAAADHPQSKNIHLVDTATASAAEGLLVARAYHRAAEGWKASKQFYGWSRQRDPVFTPSLHPLRRDPPYRVLKVNLRPKRTPRLARSTGCVNQELQAPSASALCRRQPGHELMHQGIS